MCRGAYKHHFERADKVKSVIDWTDIASEKLTRHFRLLSATNIGECPNSQPHHYQMIPILSQYIDASLPLVVKY